ncbi:hypothetical protein A0U87_25255 [Sphingobium sp. MP9-4]|nr:hypothetical protein A0U87_25255 [Sphingobium sp. MP9-4]
MAQIGHSKDAQSLAAGKVAEVQPFDRNPRHGRCGIAQHVEMAKAVARTWRYDVPGFEREN